MGCKHCPIQGAHKRPLGKALEMMVPTQQACRRAVSVAGAGEAVCRQAGLPYSLLAAFVVLVHHPAPPCCVTVCVPVFVCPAPLQPCSSQDHRWHGRSLLAQGSRPCARAACRKASPGATTPPPAPCLCHLTAHQPSQWTPTQPGGHRESWSGERGAGQTLSARLSRWPTVHRLGDAGSGRGTGSAIPRAGKKSSDFFTQ